MTKVLTKKDALQHTSIVEQVVALGQNVTLVPPTSIDEAKTVIVNAEANALLQHVQAGLCYQYLKAELPHGEYEAFLKQIDVSPRRANERVTVANLFQKLTDSNRRTSADLENDEDQLDLQSVPFSKMLALTKLEVALLEAMPPEELKALVSSPTRAMQADIKQMNLTLDEQNSLVNENHRLKAQLKETQRDYAHKVTELNHEQLKKAPETLFGIHPEVANTRQRAMVAAELLATVTAEVNHLVQRCTNSGLAPELNRDCALAINTSVSGQIMQLANSLNALHESFDKTVLTTPDNLPVYSAIEVSEALGNAEYAKGDFLATIGEL